MKRTVACSVAWFTLALGTAQAVPARLPYEPEEPAKAPSIFDLKNTAWEGNLFSTHCHLTFHADGILTYRRSGKDGNADRGSRGTWRLTGNELYFEINKYSEFKTTVQGDLMQGKGWNKGGAQCEPSLKRVPLDQ